MPQLAAAEGSVFAAKPQQRLHVRKNLLLLARATRLRERIVRVPNPSAGEIAPVVWIAAARHPNLIAIVNLRNSPLRKSESKRESQLRCRSAFGARDTRHIVIRKKPHKHSTMHIHATPPPHIP